VVTASPELERKFAELKDLRRESFYVKNVIHINCTHYAAARESLPIRRIAIWPCGCLRSSVQKEDRDCGDNAQRDEDEERYPHANRNAVGKRVTIGWHSHKSPVRLLWFPITGGSPRGTAVSRRDPLFDPFLDVAHAASPDFGPKVTFFDPTVPARTIQNAVNTISQTRCQLPPSSTRYVTRSCLGPTPKVGNFVEMHQTWI
jgi:hypothetical protein